MTTVSHVVAGVDTHKDTNVAAILSMTGQRLGTRSFPNNQAGHHEFLSWVHSHGTIERIGIEGTGSYGSGLTTHLQNAQIQVLDVNRPNRQRRRRNGKSDTADAEAAARAVLAMDMVATPKNP